MGANVGKAETAGGGRHGSGTNAQQLDMTCMTAAASGKLHNLSEL